MEAEIVDSDSPFFVEEDVRVSNVVFETKVGDLAFDKLVEHLLLFGLDPHEHRGRFLVEIDLLKAHALSQIDLEGDAKLLHLGAPFRAHNIVLFTRHRALLFQQSIQRVYLRDRHSSIPKIQYILISILSMYLKKYNQILYNLAMKFQTTPAKDAITVELIEGSLNRFDGKTLSIGYGTEKPLKRRKFVLFTRKIISVAKANRIKSITVDFAELKALTPSDVSDSEAAEIATISFVMANYEHNTYKRVPKNGFSSVDTVSFLGASKDAQVGIKVGTIVGEEVNAARELSNTPGGDMTPKQFSALAKKTIEGANTKVTVLGRKEMEKLGMGGVVGIGKGSDNEPQFVAVEYWGAAKSQKPVVLVGKGVTFDSGGLNLKPGDHMYEMHMDMSGGSAVLYTVALAAKLKLKANVVGLIPTVENMPGQHAVRPGDMLKSMSGRHIEVLNTDAEGRVILADGITYAKKYNPVVVVDVATLTGAALTALGTQASAIMSTDQKLEDTLRKLGEESGDYVWPFPVWEEYEDMTKGIFGDVPNISTDGNSRYGGVIAGGMFLREFAKDLDCPWAHIDMAPRMTANSNEFLAKGAVGAPVRLLLALIENYADNRKN